VNRLPPNLSPPRLAAGLVLPLAAYLVIRAVIGSATGALAMTEAVPAAWLLVTAIVRRKVDPIAVVSTLTVAIALALTAPTGSFVADSTAARILVLGTGAVITAGFIRRLKLQRR
jgi:hypothetical protein